MNRKMFVWTCLVCVIAGGQTIAGEVSTVFVGEANGGVTLNSAGDIYAANFGDSNAVTGSEFVWKISPTGAFDPIVFASDINIASGNDFDSKDNLFQSNFGGDAISKVDPSGVITTFADGIDGPVGIAINETDSLFVNACLENRIVQITPDGQTATFLSSSSLNCPNGITVAPNGDFYLINWRDGRIFHLSAAGVLSDFATIASPGGHLTIAGDRLYATSIGAHRIYGLELSGESAGHVVVQIGTGTAGSTDGSYSVASFNKPNGITSDAAGGILYVTDQNGVRKIVLEDEVAEPPPPPPPPATPPPSGGGGGSAGWPIILILAGMRLFGRRDRLMPKFP